MEILSTDELQKLNTTRLLTILKQARGILHQNYVEQLRDILSTREHVEKGIKKPEFGPNFKDFKEAQELINLSAFYGCKSWNQIKKLIAKHLKIKYSGRFKVPKEFYYVYLLSLGKSKSIALRLAKSFRG